MIEDKELKKQEIKNRIIDTSDLEEDTPRSRRRQNADIFTQGRRVVILLLVLVGIIILGLAFQNRFKTHTKFKLMWMHDLSEGSLVYYISLGNVFLKY